MRFAAGWAMFSLGITCAERASGVAPQQILAPDALWLWWISAFFWVLGAIIVAFRGAA